MCRILVRVRAKPGDRHACLRELKRSNARSRGRRREPCARREESGKHGGELTCARKEPLWRRPALQIERRCPAHKVEVGVSEMHEVPVDEDRSAVGEAEVVAPDVRCRSASPSIGARSPAARSVCRHSSSHPTDQAPSERNGAGSRRSRPSPPQASRSSVIGGSKKEPASTRQRGVSPNRIDRAAVPRRGPPRRAQVLDHEQGWRPAS